MYKTEFFISESTLLNDISNYKSEENLDEKSPSTKYYLNRMM
jgi:hypothetical protein